MQLLLLNALQGDKLRSLRFLAQMQGRQGFFSYKPATS